MTFSDLGIAPVFLNSLARLNVTEPTPIQAQAIPVALEGKDVVGIAQTGTGKTYAFGLPIMQRIHDHGGRGLIVLPTRELALQVDESIRKVGQSLGMRTAVLIGGAPMGFQIRTLRERPHIIITTPGRLNDHLEQKTLTLSDVTMVVLDEADRMLDMGFAPQIKQIFKHVPAERQTMLFSATMPHEIMRMANAYMKTPVRVEVAPAGTTAENVTQELFIVHNNQKVQLMEKVLQEYTGTALIFTRTKHGAKRLARVVRDMGITASELHSNRTLNQRREALQGFKTGRYRVLIATDIASRGIDVTGIELVLNYDLPTNSDDYVHRIGRTARAGAGGHAISFVSPDQRREVRTIERLVRQQLPISPLPENLPAARIQPRTTSQDRPSRSGGFGQRPSFGRQRPGGSGLSGTRSRFSGGLESGAPRPYTRRPASGNRKHSSYKPPR